MPSFPKLSSYHMCRSACNFATLMLSIMQVLSKEDTATVEPRLHRQAAVELSGVWSEVIH